MLRSLHQTHGVSLRELLPSAEFFGARDIRVTSCCGDSRNCQPGDLFVSLVGTRCDGHDFVGHAIARGATAILAERYVPTSGAAVCVVPDSREAYGRLCQALAGNPSKQIKVIGVTGTNGKTTTTSLISSVLSAAGYQVGMLGTLGYSDSVESQPPALTTPAAPELATWLSRMVSNGCSHAVMEVSSHALSQSRIAGVEFDAACVTNVKRDHLDYHGSLLNYRNAKAKLFEHLGPTGLVVLNADDPVCLEYLCRLHGPVLTVGMQGIGELTASVLEQHASEQTFLLNAGSDTVPVRTRMIGDHHVYNCLVAAAVGLAYGIDLSVVVRGLEMVERVPGRLERIDCGQPFGVFVDYAHTPHALAASLDTLREVTERRLICVFGAGGNRDAAKRPLMGLAVERRADVAIITTDNPRHESPRAIAESVLSGFQQPSKAVLLEDRAEAIQYALSIAEPGDCVLVAGKGHETYQVFGRQRFDFDDRQVAREWLYRQNQGKQVLRPSDLWTALSN